MAQQKKQKKFCPRCLKPVKRTIGAQSRDKYWVCTNEACNYRKKIES